MTSGVSGWAHKVSEKIPNKVFDISELKTIYIFPKQWTDSSQCSWRSQLLQNILYNISVSWFILLQSFFRYGVINTPLIFCLQLWEFYFTESFLYMDFSFCFMMLINTIYFPSQIRYFAYFWEITRKLSCW